MPAGRRLQAYHGGIETLTRGTRPWGGAVGTLSLITQREPCSYQLTWHGTTLKLPYLPRTLAWQLFITHFEHRTFVAVWRLTFYDVTQGAGGVNWCTTVSFFSLYSIFIGLQLLYTLNVMNSFGCHFSKLEPSQWGFYCFCFYDYAYYASNTNTDSVHSCVVSE